MDDTLTPAAEDYLRTIYELTQRSEGAISTMQLAEALDLTPGSVTAMVQSLASRQPPLLQYQKYYGVSLTPAGEAEALRVLRVHRILEIFLHDVLAYSWDEVDAHADALEHAVTPEMAGRLARLVDDPAHSPHGTPIPDVDLSMPSLTAVPLNQLQAGQKAIIQWVSDAEPEILRYLSQLDVRPQMTVHVVDRTPFDNNLHLRVNGRADPIILWPPITEHIFVQVTE